MSNLLSECRKAINQAKFNCTKQRKASALAMLAKLTTEVEAFAIVVPKAKKKAKAKAKAKPKATAVKGLSKMTKTELLTLLEEKK
tara:strand:+ start:129 stop:383 length:255 start_codon:yes stop_codon:yes gene_type:complete